MEWITSLAGIIVAVLLLAGVWYFVTRARAGNRKVREARGDPHADPAHPDPDQQDPRRDISQ